LSQHCVCILFLIIRCSDFLWTSLPRVTDVSSLLGYFFMAKITVYIASINLLTVALCSVENSLYTLQSVIVITALTADRLMFIDFSIK
jgi:hypothetical protein